MLLGTIELGQIPEENGQVGQVVLRPLKEHHDHIVATKLRKHVQEGMLACPHIEEPSPGHSNGMRSLEDKPSYGSKIPLTGTFMSVIRHL